MVRGSARIILVSHVTVVARQAHLDIPAWASRKRCLQTLSYQVDFGSPSLMRAGYKGIGEVRPACLFSVGQVEVFPGLWGASMLQGWSLLYEKGN